MAACEIAVVAIRGGAFPLGRQLSDALEVPGEDGGARRPCIQINAD